MSFTHTLTPTTLSYPRSLNVAYPGPTGPTQIHTPVLAFHLFLLQFYTPTLSSTSPNTPTQLVPTHGLAYSPHPPLSGTTLAQDIPREGGSEAPGPQAYPTPSPPPTGIRANPGEHPCPERVTSHTPQGHTGSRRDPRPSFLTPPHPTRTLTTPSPPVPLIADKALSPRGLGDKRKGFVLVPSSSQRSAPPLPGALAPASQGWGG